MEKNMKKTGWGMTVALCLWLGLFPLLHGGSYSHLTHDKWIAMLILGGMTLLAFLVDAIMRRLSRPRLVPLLIAAGLLLWTVLSCLTCDYPPEIWWEGLSARWEGLATELVYFALFFLFAFSRVSLRPVIYCAFAGLAAYLTIVFLQRAGGNPFDLYPYGTSFALNPEFQGPLGNVDIVAGYGVLLAALFLDRGLSLIALSRKSALKTADKIEFIFCLLGLGGAVYLVISIGVQFGMIALLFLALMAVLHFLPARFRLPLLALLLVLGLAAVWFWPGHGGGIWELHEILHGRPQLSFGSNRVAVWQYSIGLSKEKPLLGGGSGTFEIRFNQYLQDNKLSIPKSQDGVPLPHYFDNPHNMYIAQLTDHGLPAMLLFLALVLTPLIRKKQAKNLVPGLMQKNQTGTHIPGLYPVLTYGVQAFFCFSVCLLSPLFWVILGLSAHSPNSTTPNA